jgi:hypothetical protein
MNKDGKGTNARIQCGSCDKKVLNKDMFNHLMACHFTELFLDETNDTFRRRIKLTLESLKRADSPFSLFGGGKYYCCLHCEKALSREANCNNHHFNPRDTTKNHLVKHKLACKTLYEKIMKIRAERANADEDPLTNEPPPPPPKTSELPITSPTVIEKIVEKIVYRDNPTSGKIDKKAVLDLLGAYQHECYKNEYEINKLAFHVNFIMKNYIEMADIKVQQYQYIIDRLRTRYEVSDSIYLELKEDAKESKKYTNIAQAVRDEVSNLLHTVKKKDLFDISDEYEEVFNRLKQCIPSLSSREIDSHLPKDDD